MKKFSLHLAAMVTVLSLVFLSTQVRNGEGFDTATIADSMLDAEEFLMASETARRVLEQGNTITYDTVNANNMAMCLSGSANALCDRFIRQSNSRDCNFRDLCRNR